MDGAVIGDSGARLNCSSMEDIAVVSDASFLGNNKRSEF